MDKLIDFTLKVNWESFLNIQDTLKIMPDNTNISTMKDLSGYLKYQEYKKIYNAANLWRDRLLILLLWKTGRRVSEILELKPQDIDYDSHRILFIILKKNKRKKDENGNYVDKKGNIINDEPPKPPPRKWKYVDVKTLEFLLWFIQQTGLKPHQYVINNGNASKHLTRRRVYQIIKRCGKIAGIEKVGEKPIHPHHFRHSFAIRIAKKLKTTEDLIKLQRHLEHSSIGMTETYLQFGDFQLKEFLEDDD